MDKEKARAEASWVVSEGFFCPCLHAPSLSWWLSLFLPTSVLMAVPVPTRVPVDVPVDVAVPTHVHVRAARAPCAECTAEGARTLRLDGDADVGMLSRLCVGGSRPGRFFSRLF